MRWLQLLLVVLLLPLAACSLNGDLKSYPAQPRGPYTLDAGDVITVAVYGDDNFGKAFKVDESGTVSLPLVGPVPVRGLTVNEAAGKIAGALAQSFIRNPSVTVQIETYRPFFIQGAVKNGGQFAYVPGMTVRAAVSTAGGYSETANRNRVTVYRQTGGQIYKANVDLDFPIYPGDTIVVAERWL
jgi:polysaccharide export outer membrane protein